MNISISKRRTVDPCLAKKEKEKTKIKREREIEEERKNK